MVYDSHFFIYKFVLTDCCLTWSEIKFTIKRWYYDRPIGRRLPDTKRILCLHTDHQRSLNTYCCSLLAVRSFILVHCILHTRSTHLRHVLISSCVMNASSTESPYRRECTQHWRYHVLFLCYNISMMYYSQCYRWPFDRFIYYICMP